MICFNFNKQLVPLSSYLAVIFKEIISKSEKISSERFADDHLLLSVHSHIKSIIPTMETISFQEKNDIILVTYLILHEWYERQHLHRNTVDEIGNKRGTSILSNDDHKRLRSNLCVPYGIQDLSRFGGSSRFLN